MEQKTAPGASTPPLRILSLDGGGIRGKSSLLILENIMEGIRKTKGLDSVPKPCEYFDLIGGTSTGGIIAIMLGRLGMTVDECIRAYDEVAQVAFTPKRTSLIPVNPSGAYSATALEKAIKRTVRRNCVESTCAQQRQAQLKDETCPHSDKAFRNPACTKTVVLAITKDNVDSLPTLFTTYDTSAKFQGCTIWQVARATSAATTFFKSIKLGRDKVEFIDAGFGYNNPCDILIKEAREQFPERGQLRVLSIGTGLGDIVSIRNSRVSIIKALKGMATTSKKVAQRLDIQFGDTGQYYRFNVDRGLEDITLSDWEKSSTIAAHTDNYLKERERDIRRFVDSLLDQPRTQVVTEVNRAPSNRVHFYVPFRKNHRFVGRVEQLAALQEMLFERNCRKVALVGLGGVGKTQLALQFAQWVKENKPTYSIFWVSALSDAAFEQAYTEIARELGIDTTKPDEDPRRLVQQFLNSEKSGKWLLIVDNADDMEVVFGSPQNSGAINSFLPDSEDGLTLFTTRFRKVAVDAAVDDLIDLQSLNVNEAMALLETSRLRKDLFRDETATKELLNELTYLPLAIAQAVAYLDTNQVSIADYLNLLRGTESDMASLLKSEFRDSTTGSQRAVATTWMVSFKQIQKSQSAAADLLYFISCIESKAIPRSIFPREDTEQLVRAIGTLRGYAFLSIRDDSETFDMHSLVHRATRLWVQSEGDTLKSAQVATAHLARIFPYQQYANRDLWRAYMPHAFKALEASERLQITESPELGFRVARCLGADGRVNEALKFLHQSYAWRSTLEAHDYHRLELEHELGVAYRENRQTKEAVELLEHVVAMREEALPEDHLHRLASQHELALAYRTNGQLKKAIELLEAIVTIKAKTLAESHPDRLASEQVLSATYRKNGQTKKAIELLEHIVAIEEKTLTTEHPDRLSSQHELAVAYSNNGQIKEAIKLIEHVVAIREKTLTKDHLNRLASQHVLAVAYDANGQFEEAIQLLESVVATLAKVVPNDHPTRLSAETSLRNIKNDERYKQS